MIVGVVVILTAHNRHSPHHGVTEFATRNTADFGGFGFARVWDPLAG